MNKKYKLLKKEDNGLCRIQALKDFGSIQKGEKGGFIKQEDNLSQEGNCWVYGNAWVYGDARVYSNALGFLVMLGFIVMLGFMIMKT